MKKLIYILLLFSACKSPEKKIAAIEKDTAKKVKPVDTTFIVREAKKDFYHAVYVEKDRSSKLYKTLLGFKFDKNDSITYNDGYKVMKIKHRASLKKYDLGQLRNEWVPLYGYKGKYYLYFPNDFGYAARRILTDSTLIYWGQEGPTPAPLFEFKRLSANKYALKTSPFYQFVRSSNITIYVIDAKNMVTVWEDKSLPLDYRYMIYVSKGHAANFDMVVNHCVTEVTPEFDFDKINYKKLIKGL
jgi:hypothetical protein